VQPRPALRLRGPAPHSPPSNRCGGAFRGGPVPLSRAGLGRGGPVPPAAPGGRAARLTLDSTRRDSAAAAGRGGPGAERQEREPRQRGRRRRRPRGRARWPWPRGRRVGRGGARWQRRGARGCGRGRGRCVVGQRRVLPDSPAGAPHALGAAPRGAVADIAAQRGRARRARQRPRAVAAARGVGARGRVLRVRDARCDAPRVGRRFPFRWCSGATAGAITRNNEARVRSQRRREGRSP
jgi:hypothetical protein